jgi:glycine/D-amino acid oxidase-like deaminating enzyme
MMDIDPSGNLNPSLPDDEFEPSYLAHPTPLSFSAAETKTDDEEGDFLAKLLMRAQRMREGKDPDVLSDTGAPAEAEEAGVEENVLDDLDDDLLHSDFGDDFDAALQLDEGGEVNPRRYVSALIELILDIKR